MTKPTGPTQSGRSGLRPIERRNVDGLLPAGSDSDGNDDAARREDGQPLGWGDRVRDGIGSQVGRLGWLLLAAGLAFGSAGMAAATQPQPVTGHRPELTWAADQELSAKLDAAVRDLGLLNADVALLSKTARTVLTDLVQIDKAGLTQAWSGGSSAVDSIYARAGDLDTRLACTPWDATRDLELSKTYDPALIDRYHHICQALASVAPLRGEWEILVTGSQTAMSVASDIDTHDQAGTGALQLATQGRYPEALGELALASSAISDATSTAADLAKVLDVSTLQDWLSRTAGWDSAARVLWQAVIDSKGTITPQVTAAIKNEKAARALLPDDNAVLQVVIDELAGNLIPQGISIENSRGAFASALSDLAGGTAFGQ